MADRQAGTNYRGGYATSSSFDPDDLRVATSTFQNYVGGTVLIVFLIFFTFLFLSGLTFMLMCYARYLNRRRPTGGFYDPPPMLTRRPVRTGAPPTYGTLTGSQKTTSTMPAATAPPMSNYSSLSHRGGRQDMVPSAMSQQSYTATSTML